MTSFYDLVKNRRSIRKYENRPVEQEKIDEGFEYLSNSQDIGPYVWFSIK